MKLCASGYSSDNGADSRCKLRRNGSVPCHILQLCLQRVRANGKSLQDRNLREPIQQLDRLGDSTDQLQFRLSRIDLVHLYDPVWKVELGIAAPDPRHVAVHDGTEFVPRFRFQLPSLFPVVGDEPSSKHSLSAEGASVPTRDGQQTNQRI